ncbi:MAG: hypothetical protein A2043_06220 [Candidatus Schekmanbacteria bacterium GWA2_38_9]|uniref:Radical SAM core domain-containing protein n=1 Tax=Candidatus Schekmanbacteria bacterium RIFCSPLOWO2_12_FULL_38_15 TaxID=1817883 RepID=A0A1F7SJU9_9BACT|nr:MAG: hypothetical protein A2043_06220 [Candidatus Schekmanbacteria bacterium GWA2_38_9]OGL50736.1 MAG: hypothetical protein A3H37_02675 [Candidatus Schekmanbacteria bacterium RIFCSPLOWO2_02_FULL_38_14]OGL53504.1 MAG: hypothetical protein A3G31_08390 [Candidatus Schekmanbacteria bacterium RIFCSPLOWO2_12_FULL_38_15]
MKLPDDYLSIVQKPSRYIGNEIGSVRKNPEEVDLFFALVFPDVYEIGISNLGLRILYHILNRMKGVQAERVYSPWIDLEEILVKEKIPLTSIESKKPLKEFDIVGITLQYEMSYTNILNILRLGSIPLKSEEREEGMPLVIGGGPCAFNPEPLSQFFDAFVIGDGEDVIIEIVEVYRRWKVSKAKKNDLLKFLSEVEGVYVPRFFDVLYRDDRRIKSISNVNLKGKDFVCKRAAESLEKNDFPVQPIIPYIEAVHDRVNIEIARGCLSGCRFCQAGIIYRPLRERKADEIKELIKLSLKNSGYKEVSLTSLNTGEYSGIDLLIPQLMDYFTANKVSLSLPSLRPDSLNQIIASEIKRFKKTGFTIAPEAGSQRLRDVINKQITEDEILRAAEIVFKEGWGALKLYFMIGLPTEKMEDIEEIINLVRKIRKLSFKSTGRFKRLSVSISPFVPKSHTPFQWASQHPHDEMNEKIRFITGSVRDRRIDFEWHNPQLSFLEATIARGDRRVGDIIERAFNKGCRFDGWSEQFDFNKWMEAFSEGGINPAFYSTRKREIDEIFPWEHIHTGVSRKFLEEEYIKATQEVITRSCREKGCNFCGLETRGCHPLPGNSKYSCVLKEESTDGKESVETDDAVKTRTRFRVKFSKTGLSKYLSHLEFQNLLIRSLSRADIPVAYSKGFHPHPAFSFSFPLPVGCEGLEEYFDIEAECAIEPETFCMRINEQLPLGIKFLEAHLLKQGDKSLMKAISSFEYEIDVPKKLINANDEQKKWNDEIKDGELKELIKWIQVKEEEESVKIKYEAKMTDNNFLKPKEVLMRFSGLNCDDFKKFNLKRTRIILGEG